MSTGCPRRSNGAGERIQRSRERDPSRLRRPARPYRRAALLRQRGLGRDRGAGPGDRRGQRPALRGRGRWRGHPGGGAATRSGPLPSRDSERRGDRACRSARPRGPAGRTAKPLSRATPPLAIVLGRLALGGPPRRLDLTYVGARGLPSPQVRAACGAPDGIRTRAAGLKGRYPRPLDDGSVDGRARAYPAGPGDAIRGRRCWRVPAPRRQRARRDRQRSAHRVDVRSMRRSARRPPAGRSAGRPRGRTASDRTAAASCR